MNIWAVVVAAGRGVRASLGHPKQFYLYREQFLLSYPVQTLLASPIQGLMITCEPGMSALAATPALRHWQELVAKHQQRLHTCSGGLTRAESVVAGLKALKLHYGTHQAKHALVLVHDGVRACLHPSDLAALLSRTQAITSQQLDGAMLVEPATDSLKRIDLQNHQIVATLDRQTIVRAQTPQLFRFEQLLDCLTQSLALGQDPTDESAVMIEQGLHVEAVVAQHPNPKLTFKADLPYISHCLESHGNTAQHSDRAGV